MAEKQVNISGGGSRFKGPLTVGASVTVLGTLVAGVLIYVNGYAISKGSDVNIPFELSPATMEEVGGVASGALSIQNPINEDIVCNDVTLNVRSIISASSLDIGTGTGAIGVDIGSGNNITDNFELDNIGVYVLTGTTLFGGSEPRAFVLNGSGSTTDYVLFRTGGFNTGTFTASGSIACRRLNPS